MKMEGLLPIGSVVMLKGGNHRAMIIGYCQRMVNSASEIYDYAGCLFPEGYLGAEQNFLFNRDQIDKVYHVGYQTDGQSELCNKIEETIIALRSAGTKAE